MTPSFEFPIWHADVDLPRVPDLDSASYSRRSPISDSVTRHWGANPGAGPSVRVTSYDPTRMVVPSDADAKTHTWRGALHLAMVGCLSFIDVIGTHENRSHADVSRDLVRMGLETHRYTLCRDVLLNCDGRAIPALAFPLVPELTVIVSASLLTHAVVVATFGHRLPSLHVGSVGRKAP